MIFLNDNWYLVLVIAIVLFVLGRKVYKFFRQPTEIQMNNLREWLTWAVSEAEKRLGSGTGELKLRYVYNKFIDKFWYLSDVISFEKFKTLVDNALVEMNKMLTENEAVSKYVTGNETESEKEC